MTWMIDCIEMHPRSIARSLHAHFPFRILLWRGLIDSWNRWHTQRPMYMLIERCVLIHSLHFRDEQISGFHHQLWQCISLHNITCIHFGCTKMRRNHAIRSHLSALYTLQSASLLYYTSAHTQTPTHPNILLAWSPNDKSNTVENFKRTHTSF